ncbi:hypothetical protein [Ekhidna sp.]
MSDREIVEERLLVKRELTFVGQRLTKLLIVISTLIFFSLVAIWVFQRFPKITIPVIYEVATWFMLVSSILIVVGQLNIKEDKIEKAFRFTGLGLFFGLLFSALQVIGWKELINANLSYNDILFPFSLVHFIHVAIGLVLLVSVFAKIREYRIHSRSIQYALNVFTFWHFLGAVWLIFIGVS